MASFLWFLFLILFCRENSAQTQSCQLRWQNQTTISNTFPIILETIEDIEPPGKTLITLIGENVEKIASIQPDSIKELLYINATLVGTSIIINLTEHFVDYEKYEIRERIGIRINFQCTTGTRALDVRQPIKDTNNHDPEFENSPYVFQLPMPFPSNFSLDQLGKIIARDLDISQTYLNFSLDPNHEISGAFAISYLEADPNDPKRHFAKLMTTDALNLVNDTTFYIYATDSQEPIRTSNTTVTIRVDNKNSALRFDEPFYSANCSNLRPEEAHGFVLKFEEGDISLRGGIDNETEWSIKDTSKQYDNNFKISVSLNLEAVQISLVNPPGSFFNESSVVLILSVKKVGSAGSTVIQLTLPGRQSSEIPQMSPEQNKCSDSIPVIITLAVLLGIASAGLIASIVLWRRSRASGAAPEIITTESREEMREVERMDSDVSSNGVPRRSVAFNDTVEEIKVAKL
ncbi:uncharacterized protein [Fopius arisanus]|uniref:Cadherin domain-containing protein n=2 Tax=Fopius arisanus TaxID=64838 RepID=A0A9R1T9V4_9HYME|nr:PREDICTED: uncharacterized protein LOC105268055 [Fopius arisanus]